MTSHKSGYHVLGVMSGTSLDGIDLAEVFFNISGDGQWAFELGHTETVPYSEQWKRRLREAVSYAKPDLEQLDDDYTELLSNIISEFLQQNEISELDAVCSHGHTILHEPHNGVTLQIGNQPQLAARIGQMVVCDFRVQDVTLGGQGAPLVPIGDRLLFGSYDYCLNLGGFANVSFEKTGDRIAYDVCPVNIVLNRYAEKLGMAYDDGGATAASATVDESLLDRLNHLPYYAQDPPKSLGLEWVVTHIFPMLEDAGLSPDVVLATFTRHVAIQLSNQFDNKSSVLITGGGAYNNYLIEQLSGLCEIQIEIPAPKLIEYKEALIFALLGVLRLRGEVNCLASVTGANRDHSSGVIFQP